MPHDPLRPLVIAHRGASGYLPEHTLAAKALAHRQGADYLEQDIVATRDGELIVLHDVYLEAVTDVATKYARRARDDGHYYAIDFDLDEIRSLTVTGRERPDEQHAALAAELRPLDEPLRVPTLTEEVVLIRELNRAAGREAGIYPEVKHPGWHAANGVDLSARLLEQLERLGYVGPDAPVYVQCFDAGELRRIRTELGTRLRLVQLVNDREIYRELLQPHGLKELAQHATGISPHYRQLVRYTEASGIEPSILAQQTRDAGLLLHPHTFRRARLPVYAPTLEALLDVFLRQIRVHGVFCDYPDVAVRCRDSLAA